MCYFSLLKCLQCVWDDGTHPILLPRLCTSTQLFLVIYSILVFLYGRAALNEKTDDVTIKASYPFFSLTDVLVETFTKTLRFVSVDFNLSLIIFIFSTVGLLFTVVKILWCTKRPTGFGLCDVQMLVPAAGHATVPHGPAKSFKYLFLVHYVHFCQDI